MGALLQLERFDAVPSLVPAVVLTQADLDDAFDRGRRLGADEARSAQLDELSRAMTELSHGLSGAADAEAAHQAQALAALAPLVDALLEGALPVIAKARLQAAVLTELRRLAESAEPLQGVIHCGEDLAPFVAACVARTGLQGIEIAATAPPGGVELSVVGGRITMDQDAVAATLRGLVLEVFEGA